MRILLITFFYEPLNNIAATRLKAFNKYLTEFGHDVDVLTRRYSEKDIQSSNLNKGMLAGDDFEGDYYKKKNVIYTKFKTTNSKLKVSNKLPRGIRGLYNLSQLDVFHYSFVEYGMKAYEQEFGIKSHDIIIASSPVPASLLLAKALSKKFDIKWVADFRDSYIDGTERGLIRLIKEYKIKPLLSESNGVVYVSEGMKILNDRLISEDKPSEIIHNGFSKSDNNPNATVIDEVSKIKNKFGKIAVYTGSLYEELNLDFYLNNINKENSNNVAFVLVGLQESWKIKYKNSFKHLNIFFFDKVSQSTAIEIQNIACFLLLNVWKGRYTGFSGKVFEYLYANKPIILDYEPALDLKKYLKDFNSILYCKANKDSYNLFLSDVNQSFVLDSEKKKKIQRKFQVEKLNHFLKEIML